MLLKNLNGAVLIAIVTLASTGGCLRRKEVITVETDGKVAISLEFEGEVKDFETADALPAGEGGWNVSRDSSVNDDGKETIALRTERKFAAGEPLPSNFAGKGDRDADLYLTFPTTLRRETRDDGVYLHFRRVYTPRSWSPIQFWQDQGFDDSVKKLLEKPMEELTPDERKTLLSASFGVETYKQIELTREALKESDPDLPQDAWLAARTAILKTAEAQDLDALLDRAAGLDEEHRNAMFDEASKQAVNALQSAFRETLRSAARYDDDSMVRFETAYARARKRHQITTELGGHGFEVAVHLPGEIVAHNGDKLRDDGSVSWEFDGSAFRDRTYELMVTARMPRERNER